MLILNIFLGSKNIYYSKYFKSDITHARSVCKDYGMDLLVLNSKDDFESFMKSIKENKEILLDEWYTMGAVTTSIGSKDNWIFINGGSKLDFNINWAPDEPDGLKNQYCLTMLKTTDDFIFYDSPCSGYYDYGFFCQK